MTAAQTLARGRKSRNWALIALIALAALYVGREFDYRNNWNKREWMTILDPSTGEEVVQPVIDAETDPAMLDFVGTFCAQAIEDKNPAGLDHALLVPFLFGPEEQKKLNDDWLIKEPEYTAKQMRSKIEIMSLHHQPTVDKDGPLVVTTIVGQEINNGYEVSGKLVMEVKKVQLVLKMRVNPYRQHKNRYRLACFGFEKTDLTEVATK